MTDILDAEAGRASRLDRALRDLLGQTPELEAAAVVSYDGLPMASALPADMDEDRVAAMSAALLSLGERAAAGLGRGELTQVYIEGEAGTVFLVSAEDEAVLVAVASRGAKTGLVLFEARRTARSVADILRSEDANLRTAAAAAKARSGDVATAPVPVEASAPVSLPAQAAAPRPIAANVSTLRPARSDVLPEAAMSPEPPDGWAAWGAQNTPAGSSTASTASTASTESGAAAPTTSW